MKSARGLLELVLFFSVRYSAVFLPIIVICGIIVGGVYSYAGVGVVFGYYFFVELVLWITDLGVGSASDNEFNFVNPDNPGWSDVYGVAVYGILQVLAIPTGVFLLLSHSYFEICGGLLSLAIMSGSVGGLAGHEYLHRCHPVERFLGILVYGSVNYAHFRVSHILGHHLNVGHIDDWSTARRYESSFEFLWRAFVHGYIGAWRLETQRLRLRKLNFFSRHNFMIKTTFGQIVVLGLFFVCGGWAALGMFLVVSFIATTFMEMVNYVSHYGLRRTHCSENFEPISDKHTWESNNKVTNWFIFNAGKHCHHHRRPSEKHYRLELADGTRCLPFGLPLMVLIGFCPPIYMRMMDSLLDETSQIFSETQVGGDPFTPEISSNTIA